jgi:hypothetical protein
MLETMYVLLPHDATAFIDAIKWRILQHAGLGLYFGGGGARGGSRPCCLMYVHLYPATGSLLLVIIP